MHCQGRRRALAFLAACLITLSTLAWLFLGSSPIIVRWQTETEVDTVAFNVLRSADDDAFVVINPQPIPAQGSAISGAAYAYEDRAVQRGQSYTYRLQEITAQGQQITYPLQTSARSQRSWPEAVGAVVVLGAVWALWLMVCWKHQPASGESEADAA